MVNQDEFYVVGISINTTNENNQSTQDILSLWKQFMSGNLMEKIPNKASSEIFSVYSDYEGDYTGSYSVLLGCKVVNPEEIPSEMVCKKVPAGSFTRFVAKGNLNKGVVFNEWKKIWNTKLDRTYTVDYEVYGEKAQNPEDAEVDIFISIK